MVILMLENKIIQILRTRVSFNNTIKSFIITTY